MESGIIINLIPVNILKASLYLFVCSVPACVLGETAMLAGASAKTITPRDADGKLWMEPFEDSNGNGKYDPPNPQNPRQHHDPFSDLNGNGKWDGPWFGGFEPLNRFNLGGRDTYYHAKGVHDDIWARAIVLQINDRKVAFVALDIVGLTIEPIDEIRRGVQDLGFDAVLVGSTHSHGGPDTIGIFGPKHFRVGNLLNAVLFHGKLDIHAEDGKDLRFMEHIVRQSIAAIREADAARRPAKVKFAKVTPTEKYGILVQEYRASSLLPGANRDPIVIDKDAWIMHLRDEQDQTIGTLVNWTPHPEGRREEITEIGSDFPHYLREAIEKGNFIIDGQSHEGIGGITVYFTGPTGGQIEPGDRVKDESGKLLPEKSDALIRRIGELAAADILQALQDAPDGNISRLSAYRKEIPVPVDNQYYKWALEKNVIQRQLHPPQQSKNLNAPALNLPGEDLPWVKSEVSFISLDSPDQPVAQMVTVPGELYPELAIGGYLQNTQECWAHKDRTKETGWKGKERIKAANPDLPPEPVLRDQMNARFQFILGQTQDYLGYIIPWNDFVFPAVPPLLFGKDDCGSRDHYNESVSASSVLAPIIVNGIVDLIKTHNATKQN